MDGRGRKVIVHVPQDYTGSTKVPLVLDLHADGATAHEEELFSGMDAESEAAGFVVAYPQALVRAGSGFDWNIPGEAPGTGPDDMALLTQLPTLLEQLLCINPSRVYATGFSAGARITSQLACNDSNIFAAIAPVGGLRRPTPCPTFRAVPVISFHGTADTIDPYRGHRGANWTYSVPAAARFWASQDECAPRTTTSSPAAGVTLTTFGRCPGRVKVELYTLSGEGAEWPGGPPVSAAVASRLGPQSSAVNADSLIWAFFSEHPLR